MTDEQRAMLASLYGHQLQGIMFHFDLMCVFQLFGDYPRLVRQQYKQAVEETEKHLKSVVSHIEAHRAIVNPTGTDRYPLVIIVDERPPSKLERDSITKKLIAQWQEWEEQTATLYEKAVVMFPDCDLWAKLKRCAEKEAEVAKRLWSKL